MRMHADQREDIDAAEAGDIVAVLGVDCASGDTYASEYPYCTLRKHVRARAGHQDGHRAGRPRRRRPAEQGPAALPPRRSRRSTCRTDEETGETIIAGMGELHLEIYVERIRREYKVEVEVGAPEGQLPRGAHAGRPSSTSEHKKQTGGSGQYAHIVGRMEPLPEDAEETFVFEDEVVGGRIPQAVHPGGREGLPRVDRQGPGGRLSGRRPEGDRSRTARTTTSTARTWRSRSAPRRRIRETFPQTKPVLLEPVMKIEIECPSAVPGLGGRRPDRRRGMVMATEIERRRRAAIEGEVPLAETFGYSTDLRSMTQGQGTFTHGVRPLQAAAAEHRARSHRRAEEGIAGGRRLVPVQE